MDKQRGIVVDALCRLLVAQADSVLETASVSPDECGDTPPVSSSLSNSGVHSSNDGLRLTELSNLADIDQTFHELQKWTDLTDAKVRRVPTIWQISTNNVDSSVYSNTLLCTRSELTV
jgi:hypothetical protein